MNRIHIPIWYTVKHFFRQNQTSLNSRFHTTQELNQSSINLETNFNPISICNASLFRRLHFYRSFITQQEDYLHFNRDINLYPRIMRIIYRSTKDRVVLFDLLDFPTINPSPTQIFLSRSQQIISDIWICEWEIERDSKGRDTFLPGPVSEFFNEVSGQWQVRSFYILEIED